MNENQTTNLVKNESCIHVRVCLDVANLHPPTLRFTIKSA